MIGALITAGVTAATAIASAVQASNRRKRAEQSMQDAYGKTQGELESGMYDQAMQQNLAIARSGGSAASQASAVGQAQRMAPSTAVKAGLGAHKGALDYAQIQSGYNVNQLNEDRANNEAIYGGISTGLGAIGNQQMNTAMGDQQRAPAAAKAPQGPLTNTQQPPTTTATAGTDIAGQPPAPTAVPPRSDKRTKAFNKKVGHSIGAPEHYVKSDEKSKQRIADLEGQLAQYESGAAQPAAAAPAEGAPAPAQPEFDPARARRDAQMQAELEAKQRFYNADGSQKSAMDPGAKNVTGGPTADSVADYNRWQERLAGADTMPPVGGRPAREIMEGVSQSARDMGAKAAIIPEEERQARIMDEVRRDMTPVVAEDATTQEEAQRYLDWINPPKPKAAPRKPVPKSQYTPTIDPFSLMRPGGSVPYAGGYVIPSEPEAKPAEPLPGTQGVNLNFAQPDKERQRRAWENRKKTTEGSDEDMKNKSGATEGARAMEVFRNTPGQAYEYKDEYQGEPGTKPGPQYGIMAQDLEKTPEGSTVVEEDEDGMKSVDTSRLPLIQAAALSEIVKRLDKIDGKGKKRRA